MIGKLSALALMWSPPAIAMAQDCHYDHAAMMAMDVRSFDQTLATGWRVVGDIEGCEHAAADLIADYRTANAAILVNGDPSAIAGLNWHEAQLRAAAGETERAIQLFEHSRTTFSETDAIAGQATIAFLQHDRATLERLRDRLRAIPQPEWFAAAADRYHARTGQTLTWPDHLDELDGFINCFDRPYREAYSSACRTMNR